MEKLYFVGIGGMGMSPIAEIAIHQGYQVSGSDIKLSSRIEKLRQLGAQIFIGNSAENLNFSPDILVRSSGVPLDNPEVKAALDSGIKVIKRSEMLGKLAQKNKYIIGIAGTHGKSSVVALLGLILEKANIDPTVIMGAYSTQYKGHARYGNGDYFIAEACEFDRSFLDFDKLSAGIVTNIELNHMDHYRDQDDLLCAFGNFIKLIDREGPLVVGNDSCLLNFLLERYQSDYYNFITYGFSDKSDWYPCNIKSEDGCLRFDIKHKNQVYNNFILYLPRIYVFNSIAAIALAHQLGVDIGISREVLKNYKGLKRRFEVKHVCDNIILIDDYAHHPTKIQVTLQGAKEIFPGRRIWAIFQPRQFRRTKMMFNEFITSFGSADKIIISDISAGLGDGNKEKASVHARDLVSGITKLGLDIRYIPKLNDCIDYLISLLQPKDVIITMGTSYEVGVVNEELFEKLM